MHRLKHNEVLQIKTKELVRRQNEINEINEQLKVLGSKYGLTHYDIQLEELTKGYIKLISSGKESSKALADIKEILENFKVKGSELKELSAKFGGSLSSYLELRKEYDKALEEAEKQITYAQIVSAPYPADKKSFPVRWVIMALSVVAVLFFTIIVIGVIESRNK